MLRAEDFARAADFMRRSARRLECALFEYGVNDAAIAPALAALRTFQNADGGFGRGLEPDAATPSSGALATSVGLRYLGMLDAGADNPMRLAAVAWLRETLDPDTRGWRIVPPDTDEHPHAPWWTSEGLSERFGGFRINPRAEIVAELYRYPDAVDAAWLEPIAEDTVRAIELGLSEMHDLLGAVALLESPCLPVGYRARVRAACEEAANATVATDPAAWLGYGLQPCKVARRPNSALHHRFSDAIEANLDQLIATQGEDGAWHPTWSWSSTEVPTAWDTAEQAWKGVLTLENLLTLRAYGRIEGVARPE